MKERKQYTHTSFSGAIIEVHGPELDSIGTLSGITWVRPRRPAPVVPDEYKDEPPLDIKGSLIFQDIEGDIPEYFDVRILNIPSERGIEEEIGNQWLYRVHLPEGNQPNLDKVRTFTAWDCSPIVWRMTS